MVEAQARTRHVKPQIWWEHPAAAVLCFAVQKIGMADFSQLDVISRLIPANWLRTAGQRGKLLIDAQFLELVAKFAPR